MNFLCEHLNQHQLDIYENSYLAGSINLDDYEKIIIGTYTWGAGVIPKRLKKFIVDNHKKIKGKDVFVFGSGNSVYKNFCGAVDNLKIICVDSECNSFNSFKFEQRFNAGDYSDDELYEIKNIIKHFLNS